MTLHIKFRCGMVTFFGDELQATYYMYRAVEEPFICTSTLLGSCNVHTDIQDQAECAVNKWTVTGL